jgi:molybdenum cofactor synthesis domain-containing protein
MTLRVAIITCSDSRAAGTAADTAGPALVGLCESYGWRVIGDEVVPDDPAVIAQAIRRFSDDEQADVILTTGGTGLGPRDNTPEATEEACDWLAPGIAEAIRSGSLEITRRAMLSRGVAGLRGTTLVVNLPGSVKGATESLEMVADQFEHATEMMRGEGHG